MTVDEIRDVVKRHKPMSMPTLYKHIRALKIKPLGVSQRPQRYPEDAANRILAHLGFAQTGGRKAVAK